LNHCTEVGLHFTENSLCFLGCLLLLLLLGQVVLLGELQVAQELRVTSLHAHMPLSRRLPGGIPVVLTALVVSGMILGLGHLRS